MKVSKVLVVLIVILLLTGCAESNMSSQDKKVIKELENGKYLSETVVDEKFKPRDDYFNEEEPVDIKWELLELSKAKFWFDSNIDLLSRKEYILKSIDIINLVNKRYSAEKNYEYYISNKVYNFNDDNKIYIKYNKDKFDSFNFIMQTLFNVFGDTSHYGLIYGETVDLQKKLNMYDDNLKELDMDYIKRKLPRHNEMLDLTLPVFSDNYFNIIDIDYTRSIATNLVSYIKENYGEEKFIELLESSSEFTLEFDKLYATYINEWLKSIDVDVKKDEETVPIRYKIFGDKYFPVDMCTEWMQYCFHPAFKDQYNYWYVFDCSYKSIKDFVKLSEQEMEDVRSFLNNGYTINDSKNVITYFVKETHCIAYNFDYSYCDYYNDAMCCNTISAYLHEYSHLVSMGIDKENRNYKGFFNEGIAQYCAYRYNIYDENRFQVTYVSNSLSNNKYNYYRMNVSKELFDSYLKSIGIDNPNKELFSDKNRIFDYLEMNCYKEYQKRKHEIFRDEQFYRYTFGPIFTRYLIDNYGIEKYMEMFYNPDDFELIYSKNFASMRQDFIIYLTTKYNKFVK
ncbi:hypothetical protein JYG23_07760 [Sedimentibacter sp. zth1]|uniref:hypothetical protein n=1 Tax=Sedimentibacter sp. zth1 TaxID=2816908 RepID=UPI001A9211FA|nr:hypothetical protein [Sedimentibacter sp. zth1]QSX07228.1 hypothetical protein JYG23_07760 [Sedimentibacter sp. zth1]